MIKHQLIKRVTAIALVGILQLHTMGSASGSREVMASEVQFVPGFYDIGYSAPIVEDNYGQELLPVLRAATLPSSYDSRTVGNVTAVKNQGSLGTCWTFAAVASMESYAISHGLVESADDIDLSEYALGSLTFDDSSFVDTTGTTDGDVTTTEYMQSALKNGGNDNYIFKTLTKWAGVMNESDVPYDGTGNTVVEYDPAKVSYVLTGQYYINMANVEHIKSAIMENGAIATYYNANSEYSNDSTEGYWEYYHYTYEEVSSNHAVALVGWDDDMPKENFTMIDSEGNIYTPENNGAWLIKNSWGTYWGDSGYMWISYEDKVISNATACAYEIAPKSEYTYNYQHDGASIFGYSVSYSASKFANVFDVAGTNSQDIKAVSVGVEDANREYSIQIYLNPTEDSPESGTAMLSTPVTGSTTFAGYYTIPLSSVVKVEPGDSFSVVIEFDQNTTVSCGVNQVMYIGGGGLGVATNTCDDNQSYVYYNGTCYDLYEAYDSSHFAQVNFCIKALAVNNSDEISASTITSIESDGTTGLTINWQKVKDGIEYELLRANEIDGEYTTIYTGTNTTYKDTSVTRNTTYYYKVRVYNEENTPLDSAAVSGKLVLNATVLREITYDSTGISFSWDEVSGATGYNVYRSEDGAGYSKITTTTDTEYKDTSVKYNKTYYYMVKVTYTISGITEESGASNTLEGEKKVGAPYTFFADNSVYGQVTLTWPSCEGVEGYILSRSYWNTEGTRIVDEQVAVVGADATSYVDDASNMKLGNDATYYIVAYVTEDGEQKLSDSRYVTVNISYPPVQNIKWFVKSNIIYAKWDAYTAGGTVTEYGLFGYDDLTTSTIATSRITTATSVSIPSFTSGNTYYITIRAKNAMYHYFTGEQSPRVQVGGAYKALALNAINDVKYTPGDTVELSAVIKNEMTNFDYKYQWYEASSKTAAGTAITGATGSTYKPDTSADAIRYYYCVVSGEYNGTKMATSNVVTVQSKNLPYNISACTVSTIAAQTYTGSAITPSVTVTYNGKTLTKGTDYTIAYSNNVNAGIATITITGKGNYTGSRTINFSIVKNIPSSITSSVVNVNQTTGIISKVTVGTTVSSLLNAIDQKEYVAVYSGSTALAGTTVLTTGMQLLIIDGSTTYKQYTIVVTGDANGDGKINVADMMSVKSHILKKSTLTGTAFMAADVNGDGKINVADFMSVKGYILKKNTIPGVVAK